MPFRVMHGFSSATVLHEVAEESATTDKKLIVLYIGDFDPSGMRMSERDIPERLDRYEGIVDFRRVALTPEHCAQLGVRPSFLAKTKVNDRNHDWFVQRYGKRCWELDALNPATLRSTVERAIRVRIDRAAWKRSDRAERVELNSIEQVISAWPSIFMQASKYAVTNKP